MDLNQRKEQFSIAYARAVIAVAGYTVFRQEVDEDSVDLGIAARGGGGVIRSPRLEVQMKCTAGANMDGDALRYPLSLKNYDDLRAGDVHIPRILLVVTVPADERDWLRHSEDEMALRRCGYWLSLHGAPETLNTASVTCRLPRDQRFTVQALQAIMGRIGEGGMP